MMKKYKWLFINFGAQCEIDAIYKSQKGFAIKYEKLFQKQSSCVSNKANEESTKEQQPSL